MTLYVMLRYLLCILYLATHLLDSASFTHIKYTPSRSSGTGLLQDTFTQAIQEPKAARHDLDASRLIEIGHMAQKSNSS